MKGHIDLAALNQSTRPKKKDEGRETQGARRKEPPGRRRPFASGRNGAECVRKQEETRPYRQGTCGCECRSGPAEWEETGYRPGANQQGGGKHNKNKNRQQPVIKAEVSDEDVAKAGKETLARLTNKNKAGKGAKYRKEKRENARASMEEQLEEQAAESKVLKLTEFVTANELAVMMDVPVTQVISTCMSIGIMVSINQRLDAETINPGGRRVRFQDGVCQCGSFRSGE